MCYEFYLTVLSKEVCISFFYDILVYSKFWADHLTQLRAVLGVLAKEMFFANLKKCSFGKTEVEYLGHMISYKGVSMDSMVEAILKWTIPKTIKALRGFLGLAGYYRRFINEYGKIARLLTNLLKKRKFQMDSREC